MRQRARGPAHRGEPLGRLRQVRRRSGGWASRLVSSAPRRFRSPIRDMLTNAQTPQNLTFTSVLPDIICALRPVGVMVVFYPTLRAATKRWGRQLRNLQSPLLETLVWWVAKRGELASWR